MKTILTLLSVLGIFAFTAPVFACENHHASAPVDDFFMLAAADDFGSNFTDSTPAALSDTGAEFTAENLGNIEPAAGGEPVFILPQDSAETPAQTSDGERLAAPETALVPGMETQQPDAVSPAQP